MGYSRNLCPWTTQSHSFRGFFTGFVSLDYPKVSVGRCIALPTRMSSKPSKTIKGSAIGNTSTPPSSAAHAPINPVQQVEERQQALYRELHHLVQTQGRNQGVKTFGVGRSMRKIPAGIRVRFPRYHGSLPRSPLA